MEEILMLNNDEDKRCPRCGKDLLVHYFYRSLRNSKTSLQSYCIPCARKYKRYRAMVRKTDELQILKATSLEQILECSKEYDRKTRNDIIKVLEQTIKHLRNV